jgi:HK97 family phage major capsid protein
MTNLLFRRAEMYDKLVKLNEEYSGEKMTPTVAREFSKLCDQLDEINARISFQELEERVLMQNEERTYLQPKNEFRTNAAKKTLAEAFGMLARGERKKIDSGFFDELGDKNGLREMRTEYSSDNIVSTTYGNVFLELVKDDLFLSRIPTETITEGYYKIPVVTRENYPVAEGKANDAAASGTDTNFTSISMTPKNSYVLNRYHKDLIRDAGQRAKDAIWQSSKTAISKRLVQGILYGDSTNAGEFNGLDNISGKIVYDTSGGTIVDYSLVTRGAKELNDRFVDHSEMITLISPNTHQKFSNLRELTSSGGYLALPDQIRMIPILSNAQVKTNYSSDKTRLYMFKPDTALLGLFGNFEIELNERYAEFDHAAYMIVFRSDFVFRDPEHLFIATNLPTT